MAVSQELQTVKAKIKFDRTDVTVSGCIPTATDEQLHGLAKALGGLNNKEVKGYAKIEEFRLINA